jgi:hypothetical protein
MTTKMTPVYEDEEKGKPVSVNKITLAPKTDREYTYLLKAHVGTAGRKKDAEIFEGLFKLRSFDTEQDAFQAMLGDDGLQETAIMALDLDDEWNAGILDNLTLMDLFQGFMSAIDFRSNADKKEQATEAEKK